MRERINKLETLAEVENLLSEYQKNFV